MECFGLTKESIAAKTSPPLFFFPCPLTSHSELLKNTGLKVHMGFEQADNNQINAVPF